MSYKKGIEPWKEEFKRERNGQMPEECVFRPVPEIGIQPYFDRKYQPGTPFPPPSNLPSHSFVVHKDFANFPSSLSQLVDQYQCKNLYQPDVTEGSFSSEPFKTVKTPIPPDSNPDKFEKVHPVILDLNQLSILEDTRQKLAEYPGQIFQLWLIPGDNFLWNTGYIRGIQKYNRSLSPEDKPLNPYSIYIPLHTVPSPENERQLIPLTNRFTSLMVSGLYHCIWDLRESTDWQIKHLHLLLNIPEILTWESGVLSNGDVIRGSDFLESLSDQVFQAVAK